jgi:hypothetical protein
MKPTRRNLLQLLALAGTSSLLPRIARAGPPAVPKRIVFYYTGGSFRQGTSNGSMPATLNSWWQPLAPAAPDFHSISAAWSTNQHTLADAHAPLVPLKNKLLFLDGLDMRSSDVDPTAPANAHIGGATQALTAINRQTSNLAGGISIDQLIANGINAPMPVTPLPSLELGISSDAYPYENEAQQSTDAPSYAGAGQPVPFTTNALNIYNRILPNGPDNTDAMAQAALALKIKRQKSVLDFAAGRFSALSPKLGALDKTRLDAHASAIRDLESRLSVPMNNQCTEPDQMSVISQVQGVHSGDMSFHAHANVVFEMAQVALACDITRVMTILGGDQIPYGDFGYTAGMSGTTDFHDMCHKTNGFNAPLAADMNAVATVKAFQTAEAALFAKFLTGLDAIPEADGTTLLDNTLVVWCQQIAAHDHSLDYIPYVLCGGLGGAITMGRYVRYPRVPDSSGNGWPMYSHGRGHNDLFVSLAQLMGLPGTTSFGNPAVCQGPLDGLT